MGNSGGAEAPSSPEEPRRAEDLAGWALLCVPAGQESRRRARRPSAPPEQQQQQAAKGQSPPQQDRQPVQQQRQNESDLDESEAWTLCFAPRPRAASRGARGWPLDTTVPSERPVHASPLSGGRARRRSDSEGQLGALPPHSPADSQLEDELRESKSEVEHLRAQLARLRSRPSTRSLRIATAEPALLAEKDFEIANLKKDLVLSQLRAETAIKTAVNSINARKVMPSSRNLLASEGGERGATARSAPSRLNTVATLDQQLLDNNLSLDEYALALATLTQGEEVDDVSAALAITGLHEAAQGGGGSASTAAVPANSA